MTEPRLLGDRYELSDVLGRGGMAEVRRGRDLRLGRVVAIKMLRVDHAADATFQARFRREAQSAASLNHRNIVAVYDTGEDFVDGHRIPYIVMEYVEGRTLREFLQQQQRFTPERSIEVTAGVLDALEYSHQAGIVHRDIKPGNVMITGAGEVKVMDFGIARSLAETGAALTQTAAVVGTAQYISPEQARGEAADARSDLYATGCVLYELLTGRPPFIGESLVSVAVSHVREMVTPPSALDPSIPRDIDAIVLKSLAKDRLERYQSAYEMRTDLERAAAGIPVAAAADATAATQFIGGGAYDETAYDQDPTAMYDDVGDDYVDEEDEGGVRWAPLIWGALAILAVAALIGFLIFRGGTDEPTIVTVPQLLGQTQEQAQAWADGEGVILIVETQETNNVDEEGIVLQQDPAPNGRVDEGGTVTIHVGVGPDAVTVPDVTGRTEAEARQLIENADLVVGDVRYEETTEEAEQGIVLAQSPNPNSDLSPGSEVDLVVGEAPDSITVPNLSGMTRDQARDTLRDDGLELGDVSEESSSDVEEGRVIRSDPGGGSSVEPGTSVNIVLSSGEAPATVPNVSTQGFNEAQATSILEQEGFEVDAEPVQRCDLNPDTVFSQDPAAGQEVSRGSTIRIAVATDDGCEPENDNGDGDGDNGDGGDEGEG